MTNAMNPSKASDYDSEPGAHRVAPQIRTPVIPSATDLEDWLKPRLLLSTPQVSGCLLWICRPTICNSEKHLTHQW